MLTSAPYFGVLGTQIGAKPAPTFFSLFDHFHQKRFFQKISKPIQRKKEFQATFYFSHFFVTALLPAQKRKKPVFCGFSGFSCILPIRKFFFGLYDLLYVFPCLATIIPDSYRPFFVYNGIYTALIPAQIGEKTRFSLFFGIFVILTPNEKYFLYF